MLLFSKFAIFVVCVAISRQAVATQFENPQQGLNYWPCLRNNDCYGDRECLNMNGVEGDGKCLDGASCVCVPKEFTSCQQNTDCQFGEQCRFSLFHPLHCTTLPRTDGVNSYPTYDADVESALPTCGPCESESPQGSPDVSMRSVDTFSGLFRQDDEAPRKNYTYNSCNTGSDCEANRKCINVLTQCCCGDTPESVCMCLPPRHTFCSSDDDCVDAEEECLRTKVDPPRCVSRTARENFAGETFEDGGVCIAAVHLQHIASDNLVFARNVPARVLCDQFESCATAGHMVVFHGVAMTMATYCGKIGNRCSVRQMTVNSPAYKRQLRVASRTAALFFTPFSTSHETWLEERFLQVAIHLGL